MTCDGCQNLCPEAYGVDCPRNKCIGAKGHEYCNECLEYTFGKCEKFENMNRCFVKKGKSLHENLSRNNSYETDVWLAEQGEAELPLLLLTLLLGGKNCLRCGKPLK